MYGFNYTFGDIQVDGGNVGIDVVASDVRGNSILSYTASTALKIHAGSEHIKIHSVTLDTPDYLGLQIDSSHDISLNVSIFENDQAISGGTGTITRAIRIGKYSGSDHVNNLDLMAKVVNTGGKGMDLYNIDTSKIFLIVSNAPMGTGNLHPNTVGIEFFTGVGSDVRIELLTKAPITPTLGVIAGSFAANPV